MEKDSYPAGVPSWVDIGVPDMDAAVAFYGGLFGWEFDEGTEETGGYRQARVNGRAVAGFGPQMNPGPPTWSTYISTDDADAAAGRVVAAGGQVIMAPMDVMTFGRMAVCMDSTGAFFSLWQAGDHPGAQLVGEPGTLCWSELNNRNPDAAKAFYAEVFGWEFADNPMGDSFYTAWLLDGEGIGGMLPMVGPNWTEDIPNHWLVYFGVPDPDAACSRITELGGTVVMAPFDTPGGRIAVAADTAGAFFAVIDPARMG